MFLEFKSSDSLVSTGTGRGLRTLAYMLDYVLTGTTSSKTLAVSTTSLFTEWSTDNPGGWVRRETNGDFSSSSTTPSQYWAWSAPVLGKPNQAFFHKGFALRWNAGASNVGVNNYFQGYMGAFQSVNDRTTFGSFDFGRPLNHNFTTNTATTERFDTLTGGYARTIDMDRYVLAAAEGYMFIGNIDRGTFWAITDGTTLPIHEYTTSSAIPMIGLTGLGPLTSPNTRHDLRVHVHKYDSGAGASHNQLSSFDQLINGDNTTPPSSINFLSLYPSSANNQGFLDRFDAAGKRTTALYPIIIGNPIRGNAYQTTEGLLLLSGQNHETGQTFYVGTARYYKFVCSHDLTRSPAFSGLVIGIPIR